MCDVVQIPATRKVWHRLMDLDPLALPYQSPEWVDAVCTAGSYRDVSRHYQLPSGTEVVVPIVQAKLGPRSIAPASSLPDGWGIGGMVGSRSLTSSDVSAIVTDLSRLNLLYTRIRPNPLRGDAWETADTAGLRASARRVHVLDLRGGFDTVWTKRFSKSTRSGVRHAQRAGLEIERDTTGRLVGDFYSVLESAVERWARSQNEPLKLAQVRFRRRDPISKFHAIARSMGDSCRIWVARLNGQPIAASMRLVREGGNANASRSAMIKEIAGPVRANDLLQQLAIEDACASGCSKFVLGESGQSQEIAAYKERFGATPIDYHSYHVDPYRVQAVGELARAAVKRAIGFRDDDQQQISGRRTSSKRSMASSPMK